MSPDEAQDIAALRWMRPGEISIKSQLVGFTKLASENVSEAAMNQLVGDENADYKRVKYGAVLENRWFLNAATMLAQEMRQLD